LKRELTTDAVLVRYLLGQVNETERDHIEELLFLDEDNSVYRRIVELEDELMDRFLDRELTTEEEEQFTNWFLVSKERQEKFQYLKSLRESLRETSEPTTGRVPLYTPLLPRLAWVGLLASVVVLMVGYIVFFRAERQPDVGPRLAETSGPKTPERQLLSFILDPGYRSSRSQREIVLPASTAQFELRIPFDTGSYWQYRATLRAVDERNRPPIKLTPTKAPSGGQLAIVLDSQSLQPGDYALELEGELAGGTYEIAGGFSFRLVKDAQLRQGDEPHKR
jgi:hypothetical protein